ncbi:MAG: IS1380 family transposase, partial [Verrucomicrobiota bacterium]|nr:IS1380 family transposase [Verrucomicrobiota bacterium]
HSELKSDMDVERLPSGKFATNATVLRAAMPAFNVLRRIGQGVLAAAGDVAERLQVQRLRLRTVLQDIMCVACRHVRSGHRHVVKPAKDSRWIGAIRLLNARL